MKRYFIAVSYIIAKFLNYNHNEGTSFGSLRHKLCLIATHAIWAAITLNQQKPRQP